MEKDGFEAEPVALRSFGFNISTNIVVSPENPVVLRMWPQGAKEKLVTGDKFFGIKPDGRTYTIDLLKGTKQESATALGDMRIQISRPENVKFQDRYDWSFSITIVDGGVVEETDSRASMYRAPIGPYAEEFKSSFSVSSDNWVRSSNKRFYVKTRNMFGRLEVHVFPFYDLGSGEGSFGVKYFLNPSGSPTLR